jgi:predicted RecB family nuclease
MKVSADVFEAFIDCATKCWLRAVGEPTSGNAYAEWVNSQKESYRADAAKRLMADVPANECDVVPSAGNLKTAKWRVAVGVELCRSYAPQKPAPAGTDGTLPPDNSSIVPCSTANLEASPSAGKVQEPPSLVACLHALKRVPSEGRGKLAQFIPVRFFYKNKLTKNDRLLLAFDAFVLSEALGRDVSAGQIVYGKDRATLRVNTSALVGDVRKSLEKIAALLSNPTPPDLVLNRHCTACEFQTRCRQKAIEKDDLSLLAGMSEKERKKLHRKGIFTVTQLSYTFRPRHRPKRLRDKLEKYHHSLKALAIREKKIHIVGSPQLKIEGTPVYLDVEGLPDDDFYYLIGVRIGNGASAVQHSLWADSAQDEKRIWREFLGILDGVENPVLIHYGSYETIFLRRMGDRHGKPPTRSIPDATFERAVNLLSVVFAQVYYPCHSNGLKEVAKHLGFQWSDDTATGMKSIVWRQEWETSRAAAAKESLLAYNAEDCQALEVVSNCLIELRRVFSQVGNTPSSDVVDISQLKREHPYGFKRNTFASPELDAINNAAYWDYQRERIYVKSNRSNNREVGRNARPARGLSPSKTVECAQPRSCPKCNSPHFFKHTKSSKTVFDLKFMRYGIKRWITRYCFHNYQCQNCGAVFPPEEKCWDRGKLGSEIIAYALYLNIELRLPQIHVDQNLNKLFGFQLPVGGVAHGIKERAAKTYRGTYEALLTKLCSGRLLHADETKISIRGNDGFVWIFASTEEVAYVYSETREGDLLQTMLKDFRGVLVSDFYAAYDAIPCPQQKCLIHLIRDLNEDVLKHPYDEELKRLGLAFAVLLRAMVETVDRFGLKSRFLRRHLSAVDRFYRQIGDVPLQSEIAIKLKDRLEKNRDKLFTFLMFDDVPWNNNNAEHAVKPFAALRQIIGGITSENGIRDYLVLLSICETCKYMGLDFLDFVRSGEKDIHTFRDSRPAMKARKV